MSCGNQASADRDSVKDIYGQRSPYKQEWPSRVDHNVVAKPDKWVQSACVLCRSVLPFSLDRAIAVSTNGIPAMDVDLISG